MLNYVWFSNLQNKFDYKDFQFSSIPVVEEISERLNRQGPKIKTHYRVPRYPNK